MKRLPITAFVILLLLPIMTPALTDKAAASRIPGAEGGAAPPAPVFEITLPAIGETDPRAGLAGFTQYFFILLLGLGGVLAFAMIAFAGLQWTLSGANPSLQGDAKDRILNAVFGLVLLLGAVVILNTINPELVRLREPRIGLEPLPPATERREGQPIPQPHAVCARYTEYKCIPLAEQPRGCPANWELAPLICGPAGDRQFCRNNAATHRWCGRLDPAFVPPPPPRFPPGDPRACEPFDMYHCIFVGPYYPHLRNCQTVANEEGREGTWQVAQGHCGPQRHRQGKNCARDTALRWCGRLRPDVVDGPITECRDVRGRLIEPLTPLPPGSLAERMDQDRTLRLIWADHPGVSPEARANLVTLRRAFDRLQAAGNRRNPRIIITAVSAYRPADYQRHLWEIRDRWCTRGLSTNTHPNCAALRRQVEREINDHFDGRICDDIVVGRPPNRHSMGIAVDVSGFPRRDRGGIERFNQLSNEAQEHDDRRLCLEWPDWATYATHLELVHGCVP